MFDLSKKMKLKITKGVMLQTNSWLGTGAKQPAGTPGRNSHITRCKTVSCRIYTWVLYSLNWSDTKWFLFLLSIFFTFILFSEWFYCCCTNLWKDNFRHISCCCDIELIYTKWQWYITPSGLHFIKPQLSFYLRGN